MSEAPVGTAAAAFVARLYQALAVARLHELTNSALEEPIQELRAGLVSATSALGPLSLKPDYDAEVLFLNNKPVTSKKAQAQTIDGTVKILAQLGIGELRFHRALDEKEIGAFLKVVKESGAFPAPQVNCLQFIELIEPNGLKGAIDVLTLEQAAAKAVDKRLQVDDATAARLAYARTLALLREFLKHMRDEELQRYFWRKLLRAVQGLQSLVARVPDAMLALTLVKDADERIFNHAVNTSILSILLAQKAGLPRAVAAQAGLVGLLQGVGKFRTDEAVVAKRASERTPEEEQEYRKHPYRAVGALLGARRLDDAILASIMGTFHVEADGSFPDTRQEIETPHPLARIVAIAEAYDALTSPRPDRPATVPDQALAAILGGQLRRSFDIFLVGIFAKMIGLFPPGSAVRLDSGEIAVVVHPNPEMPKRPTVSVVRDALGHDVDGDVIDLAAKGPDGKFPRRIVDAVDAVALGLKIPEYLLG